MSWTGSRRAPRGLMAGAGAALDRQRVEVTARILRETPDAMLITAIALPGFAASGHVTFWAPLSLANYDREGVVKMPRWMARANGAQVRA